MMQRPVRMVRATATAAAAAWTVLLVLLWSQQQRQQQPQSWGGRAALAFSLLPPVPPLAKPHNTNALLLRRSSATTNKPSTTTAMSMRALLPRSNGVGGRKQQEGNSNSQNKRAVAAATATLPGPLYGSVGSGGSSSSNSNSTSLSMMAIGAALEDALVAGKEAPPPPPTAIEQQKDVEEAAAAAAAANGKNEILCSTLTIAATTATTSSDNILIEEGGKTTTTTMTTAAMTTTNKVPFPIVLWRFTRPHTLIGSALAIPALHLLAAPPTWSAAFSATNLCGMLYGMIPALLMNLYITGLNQITDVDIDRINKPDLPIAAGILSPTRAMAVCIAALLASLSFTVPWGSGSGGSGAVNAIFATQGLSVALWGSGLLGTLYSLPPFRLKRFPVAAAFCIVAVRGTIINASFFAHARAVLTAAAMATTSTTTSTASTSAAMAATSVLSCLRSDPRCWLSSAFFAVFGVVIALMKDVPDVLGDRASDIRTFSVRAGPERIFRATRRLLTALLVACGGGFAALALQGGAAAAAQRPVVAPLVLTRAFVAAVSLGLGWSVRTRAASVDPTDPKQVYKYYMHLWKIFYLCYLVLPLAR
jgi:homogentisate phytyltransferase / homogentisate geranylgeranyltransferase